MKRLKWIAILLSLFIFAGCSSKDVEIDINKLADDLKNNVSFADTLDEPVNSPYTDVDEADIKAQKIYFGTGATGEMIAVFETVDKDAAGRVLKALEDYIEYQMEENEDYNPDAIKRLKDPVLIKTGKYVILCVSDDNAAAKECINKYTK
ncbi:MAG TPA: DUF4358 domain-containing protein [Clostridiales bacterium]|nr:DUF4358 domain-containing protein [Clostridiales bacterium]